MKRLAILIITIASFWSPAETYAQSGAGISLEITVTPPELPVYVQPECPVEGYLWTPGYWAWGPDGYYWVPGVWVRPARVGWLWTPGYWGFERGYYFWHGGYWGSHIGFYGGVCYGFGYYGSGFCGGRWEGNAFRYNTAVCRVNNGVIRNTYVDKTVINNSGNHVSYNGGSGINAKPNASEQSAMKEVHGQPSAEQLNHQHTASTNKAQLAKANGGHPSTMSMASIGGKKFNAVGKGGGMNKGANKGTRANSGQGQRQHAAGQAAHNTGGGAQRQHNNAGAQHQQNAGGAQRQQQKGGGGHRQQNGGGVQRRQNSAHQGGGQRQAPPGGRQAHQEGGGGRGKR